MTKKEKAFELFTQGKDTSSPEIKALGLKGNVKYNYYSQWKSRGGTPLPSSGSAAGSRGGVPSELEMVAAPQKMREGEGEVREGEGEDVGTEVAEVKAEKETEKGGDGNKPLRRVVAGQGLSFQITISTKTLQLYQIAASMQEEELTIGDFIDTCVEDYYRGRGFDLGLIKIGGEGENG